MATTISNHTSALNVLIPLMDRYGVRCSVEEFQTVVNLVFHDIEAELYDDLYQDMWQSLPAQFDLVAGDVAPVLDGDDLHMLDIGCGTGLSTELMLRSPIGRKIRQVHLLDTSQRMLDRAMIRLSEFPIALAGTRGTTAALAEGGAFDLILMCSVLHHVPDLKALATEIARLQQPHGVFIHLQDPNADSAANPNRAERMQDYDRAVQPHWPRLGRFLSPKQLIGRLRSRLFGGARQNYMDRVSHELVARGLTRRPMSPPDVWAVTDIHIGSGEGISIKALQQFLPGYELISHRSYAFFSQLRSRLPGYLAIKEDALVGAGSLEGFMVSAAWRKLQQGTCGRPSQASVTGFRCTMEATRSAARSR